MPLIQKEVWEDRELGRERDTEREGVMEGRKYKCISSFLKQNQNCPIEVTQLKTYHVYGFSVETYSTYAIVSLSSLPPVPSPCSLNSDNQVALH